MKKHCNISKIKTTPELGAFDELGSELLGLGPIFIREILLYESGRSLMFLAKVTTVDVPNKVPGWICG